MTKTKVSIQGEPGAFHHIACEQYFGSDVEIIFRSTFGEVFDDLLSGKCDFALSAFKSTQFGEIKEANELIKKHSLKPIDQVDIHVNFCLVGLPGTSFGQIKQVYSQVPALVACRDFLEAKLPNAVTNEYYDTAGAAKYVSEQKDPAFVSIASSKAAEIYGLEILAEDISNGAGNVTSFAVLQADSKQ